MYKVVLFDGTEITNCLVGTTSDYIKHAGETYSDAASILDIITPQNSVSIRVEDENGTVISSAGNLVLLSGGVLSNENNTCVCAVSLRHKTETEKMQDEIAELQEVIIEE